MRNQPGDFLFLLVSCILRDMKKQTTIRYSLVLVALLLSVTLGVYVWRTTHSDGNLGYRDEVVGTEFVFDETVTLDIQEGDEEIVINNEAESESRGLFTRVIDKVSQKVQEVETQYFAKATVSYPVPFTSQAPYAVWDPPYDEACEEASMLMVDAYLRGKVITQASANESIFAQVAWQEEHGYAIDITVQEVVEVLGAYFKLEAFLETDPTPESIEYHLSEGSLVIVPAAGRLLGNPYFTAPGPVYHMFVITGYDHEKRQFITNDPGTRRGEGYRYSYDVIMNAIHDWNDGDVLNGQKVIVIVPSQE